MSNKTKRRELDVTDQFIPSFNIKDIKFTPKQRDLIRIIRDENTKIVFIDSCAGVGKTFVVAFCGLLGLREKSIEKFSYCRELVENSVNKIGFLPGGISEKLDPYALPLIDQLEQMVDKRVYEDFIANEIINIIPTNFLRGRTFRNSMVCIDESQNISWSTLKTIISRVGDGTKLIFLGDSFQTDVRNSGLEKMIRVFDDDVSREMGIHSFKFTSEDIRRSDILKFIMSRLEKQV